MGQPAPDFTLKDTSGKTVRLSDFRGKPVMWLSINSTEKVSSDYLEPAKLMAWTQGRPHRLADG